MTSFSAVAETARVYSAGADIPHLRTTAQVTAAHFLRVPAVAVLLLTGCHTSNFGPCDPAISRDKQIIVLEGRRATVERLRCTKADTWEVVEQ